GAGRVHRHAHPRRRPGPGRRHRRGQDPYRHARHPPARLPHDHALGRRAVRPRRAERPGRRYRRAARRGQVPRRVPPRAVRRPGRMARGHVVIAPAPAALELFRVSKRFPDGTAALDRISLEVEPGEFVSVVGPSGCGKSTLLRIVSGLSKATRGSVTRDTDDLGYVFQDATLLPWRTVQRNVELPAELRGLPRGERRARAVAAIDRVGLTDVARHRPPALSGGMRMRASLARALTLRPKLFLFDEPFGSLDEITRERLGDELQELYVAE